MKRLGLILSILLLSTACSTDDITSDSNEGQYVPVEVATVEEIDLEKTLEISGQAMPNTIIPLFTPTPLEVIEINTKVGNRVNVNDILLKLNDEMASMQVNQAKKVVSELENGITKAKALQESSKESVDTLKQIEMELEESVNRARTLINELNEEETDTTLTTVIQEALEITLKQTELAQAAGKATAIPQINVSELEMQLEAAKQNVKQAEKALNATKLSAPIDGVIAELNVSKNQIALPNTPIATIVNLDPIIATFFVNSYQVVQLEPNMKATIQVEGISDPFTSEIKTVSPTVNPQSNLFEVEIPISNVEEQIKGGMRLTAAVSLGNIARALVIPVDSILYDDNKPYVYIVDKDTAIRKDITLGIIKDEIIEVVDGLNLNDRVVTRGKERLNDGTEIKIRNE